MLRLLLYPFLNFLTAILHVTEPPVYLLLKSSPNLETHTTRPHSTVGGTDDKQPTIIRRSLDHGAFTNALNDCSK